MEIEREVNKYINFVKEQNSSMVKFAISCLKASGFKIDWNDITVNDNGIIEFKPDFMRSFENNNDGNDIIAREDTIIYYLGDLNSSDKEMSKLYVDKYKTLTPEARAKIEVLDKKRIKTNKSNISFMVDGLRDCIMCCELYAYIAEAIRKETIRCIESYFKHNEGRIIGTVNDITVTVNCDGSCDGCMSFSSDFIKNNADRIYKGKIISKKFFDHINYNVKKVIGRELENVSPIISPHSSNTLCLLIEKGEEERITSNEAALYSLRQQSEIIVKSANHVDECEEIKKCEKPAINKPINITKNNQNKDSSEEGSKCGDLGKEEELKQQVKVSNLHKTKDYSSVISELTERVKTLNREYDNELSQVESLEKRTKEEVVKNSNKQPILQLSSE